MSEKVKLPREVAESLDTFMPNHQYPIRVLFDLVYSQKAPETSEGVIIYDFSCSDRSRRIELLAKAMVNGYEVQETPEDKVIRLYNTPNCAMYNPNSYKAGVIDALNALNMKIEGVNA